MPSRQGLFYIEGDPTWSLALRNLSLHALSLVQIGVDDGTRDSDCQVSPSRSTHAQARENGLEFYLVLISPIDSFYNRKRNAFPRIIVHFMVLFRFTT